MSTRVGAAAFDLTSNNSQALRAIQQVANAARKQLADLKVTPTVQLAGVQAALKQQLAGVQARVAITLKSIMQAQVNAALGDVGALAATLMFVIQFIKRQFERQSRPLLWWQTLLLTLTLGEGVSALLFYAGYGARFGNTAPLAWILFGLVASAIASGLKDLLTSLAERNRSEVMVTPTPALPPAPVTTPESVPTEQPPADIASTDSTLLSGFEPDPAATHFNLLAPDWADDAPGTPGR